MRIPYELSQKMAKAELNRELEFKNTPEIINVVVDGELREFSNQALTYLSNEDVTGYHDLHKCIEVSKSAYDTAARKASHLRKSLNL